MSELRRRLMMAQRRGGIGYYTIDQTGAYTSPIDMIMDRNLGDIQVIRNASHLYVGELVNGVLQCKQVSDNNKGFYLDNTPVSYGSTKNLFMKLPQFWWKCETLDNDGDIVKFSFSIENPEDVSWFEWEGDTFIGVYEASTDIVDNVTILRSINGVVSSGGISYNNFKSYSRNTGPGFQLITYESHQIMALLGYGYLRNLNSQAVCGYGTNSDAKTNGMCDSLGMTDTINSSDNSNPRAGNIKSINFWGLENWWGNKYEFLDNLTTSGSNCVLKDINSTTIRTIAALNSGSGYNIRKMVFGSYGDVLGKLQTGDLDFTKYYCDHWFKSSNSDRVATRSSSANNPDGGISAMRLQKTFTQTGSDYGTRIQYKGNYIIQ